MHYEDIPVIREVPMRKKGHHLKKPKLSKGNITILVEKSENGSAAAPYLKPQEDTYLMETEAI